MLLGSVWLLHELLSLYSSKVGRLLVLFVLSMAFQRDADLVLVPRKLESCKPYSMLSFALFFNDSFPTCCLPLAQSQSWARTLKLHSVQVIQ